MKWVDPVKFEWFVHKKKQEKWADSLYFLIQNIRCGIGGVGVSGKKYLLTTIM